MSAGPRFSSSLQAGLGLGRAMRSVDPLPSAAPYVTITLHTPDGKECFFGALSWACATLITGLLEAEETRQERPVRLAEASGPRLRLLPTP